MIHELFVNSAILIILDKTVDRLSKPNWELVGFGKVVKVTNVHFVLENGTKYRRKDGRLQGTPQSLRGHRIVSDTPGHRQLLASGTNFIIERMVQSNKEPLLSFGQFLALLPIERANELLYQYHENLRSGFPADGEDAIEDILYTWDPNLQTSEEEPPGGHVPIAVPEKACEAFTRLCVVLQQRSVLRQEAVAAEEAAGWDASP